MLTDYLSFNKFINDFSWVNLCQGHFLGFKKNQMVGGIVVTLHMQVCIWCGRSRVRDPTEPLTRCKTVQACLETSLLESDSSAYAWACIPNMLQLKVYWKDGGGLQLEKDIGALTTSLLGSPRPLLYYLRIPRSLTRWLTYVLSNTVIHVTTKVQQLLCIGG